MLFVVVPRTFIFFLALANKSAGGSKDDSLLAILIVSREAECTIHLERGPKCCFVFPYKRKNSPHRHLNVVGQEFAQLESFRSRYKGNME